MKGGPEAKCTPKGWEETIGNPRGKACPRPSEELWPDLYPVFEILEFAVNDRLKTGLGLRAELVGEVYGMTSEELNDTLSLVSSTLSHPDVAAILNPPVEV